MNRTVFHNDVSNNVVSNNDINNDMLNNNIYMSQISHNLCVKLLIDNGYRQGIFIGTFLGIIIGVVSITYAFFNSSQFR